jgi:molecular chaperone GrpE
MTKGKEEAEKIDSADQILNQIREDESNHQSNHQSKQDSNETDSKKSKESHIKQKPSYDELLDMLKRAQANLENFRKQTDKRIDEIREFAKRDVISKFIPVLDSFDLARKDLPKDDAGQLGELCKGIEMISEQLGTTIKDLDVELIDTEGKFDPSVHEALSKIPSDKPEGTILEVFQSGFKLHGKVLRAARVQVSAGPFTTINENQNNNSTIKTQAGGGVDATKLG